MKPCRQENIHELLDGELSPTEAGAVRSHLRECAACARLYRELRSIAEVFDKMPAPELEQYYAGVLRQNSVARYLDGRSQVRRDIEDESHDLDSLRIARNRGHIQKRSFSAIAAMVVATTIMGFITGFVIRQNLEPVAMGQHIQLATGSPRNPADRVDEVPEKDQARDETPHGNVRVMTDASSSDGKVIIVDRVLPSGVRVIWNYASTDAE